MGLPDYASVVEKSDVDVLARLEYKVKNTPVNGYLNLTTDEVKLYTNNKEYYKALQGTDVPISTATLIPKAVSDGSTASYYELPTNCKELQDLISAKNMNAQIGEIFRECYRYGQASHSDELRGIKKILFYANAELKRLENVDS
jgi:hypothetical protein